MKQIDFDIIKNIKTVCIPLIIIGTVIIFAIGQSHAFARTSQVVSAQNDLQAPKVLSATATYCSQGASITLSGGTTNPPGSENNTITFRIKMQGVQAEAIAPPSNRTQNVRVTLVRDIYDENDTITDTETYTYENVPVTVVSADASGIAIWEGGFDQGNAPAADTYAVLIKGGHHLQKKFCINNPTEQIEQNRPYTCNTPAKITLSDRATKTRLDFSQVLLQPGDINVPGKGQDGVINAHDVSILINALNDPTTVTAEEKKAIDLDFNNVINTRDRSNLIETLETKYDDEG